MATDRSKFKSINLRKANTFLSLYCTIYLKKMITHCRKSCNTTLARLIHAQSI